MAHTPGPWVARPDSGQIVLNGANIYSVKEICNEQGGFNPDDIRLMAAAPDMLAVCQRLLSWQSEDDPYACDDWMEFATDLGAMAGRAIAKAEGRTDDQ